MRADDHIDETTGPAGAKGIIRAYAPADREAVRDICRHTAYRNRGSHSIFEDGELFADYWTRYYTDYEPESCLVVEEDGVVVGYLLGCVDERRHRKFMIRRIVPVILARAFWRLATFQYRNPNTRRMLYWLLTRGPREEPKISLKDHPAHYHCNILPAVQGKNYYTRMALIFIDRLIALGVPGLHGQVEEPAGQGPWTRMVTSYVNSTGKPVYGLTGEAPSTFRNYMFGEKKPMVNRVWAADTEVFRDWVVWVSKKFHM
jgi:hypothetical protein